MDKKELVRLIEKSLNNSLTSEEAEKLENYESHFNNDPDILETQSADNKDVIRQDIRRRISERLEYTTIQRQDAKVKSIHWFSVAACTVMALGFLFYFLNNFSSTSPVYYAIFRSNNAVQQIILPDGSIAYLNEGSVLELEKGFGHTNRNGRLRGEAYFNINRDTLLPFNVIDNQGLKIGVLGTRFYVRSTDEEQAVALVSGSVSVQKDNGRNIILQPNEIATADSKNGFKVKTTTFDRLSAWKPEGISIDNMMLTDLFSLLSKRYHINTKITDQYIAGSRISFTLHEDDTLEDILELASAVKGFRYALSENELIVYKP